jgi:hypothetical protein
MASHHVQFYHQYLSVTIADGTNFQVFVPRKLPFGEILSDPDLTICPVLKMAGIAQHLKRQL